MELRRAPADKSQESHALQRETYVTSFRPTRAHRRIAAGPRFSQVTDSPLSTCRSGIALGVAEWQKGRCAGMPRTAPFLRSSVGEPPDRGAQVRGHAGQLVDGGTGL